MNSNKKSVLIEAIDIKKSFHVRATEVEVLHSVSFTINEGEFVIIYGPSGCGKSTLLHIMLGLEAPTAGEVRFNNFDIYQDFTEDDRANFRKRNIGMVYQQPNWIKALNVFQNVGFALKLNGVSDEEVMRRSAEILELVGMSEWSEYFPMELSSGQQQKVALARAIITNPRIIIADEPTGNLDFDSGEELMNLLTKLNQEGKTIVMVTHDLEYLKYAQRAVKMFNGEIVGEVDQKKLKQKSVEYLTRNFQYEQK